MSSYRILEVTPTTAAIHLGRAKIGHAVRKHDDSGQWFGTMQVAGRRYEFTGARADMLRGLVQQANRVALCGENNAEKAAAALAKRNAETEARNAQQRAEFAPLYDMLAKVAMDMGRPMPRLARARSRRIAI